MKIHAFDFFVSASPRLRALVLIFFGVSLPVFASGPPLVDNVVLRWNHAMLDAIRTETTPPPLAARNLAILHLSIHATTQLEPSTGRENAMEAAARVICETLYPGQAGRFRIVWNSPDFLSRRPCRY